jgi:hypothetical protein
MRRFARLALGLAVGCLIAVVALAIGAFLLRDTIVKEVFIRRLRAGTGMGVEVAAVQVGVFSPTLRIAGLKLYNSADFGGGLCLDMPELSVEYDRAALRQGSFHLLLVRLDLAGLTVVKNKEGRTNFESLKKGDAVTTGHNALSSGLKFDGIDTLDLSLGKFHLASLASGHEQVIDFGVKHQIFHHVRSEADLNGLGLLLAMRGSSPPGEAGIDMGDLLKALTAP